MVATLRFARGHPEPPPGDGYLAVDRYGTVHLPGEVRVLEYLSRRLLHRVTRDVSRERVVQRTLGIVRVVGNRLPKFLIHRHDHLMRADAIEPHRAREGGVRCGIDLPDCLRVDGDLVCSVRRLGAGRASGNPDRTSHGPKIEPFGSLHHRAVVEREKKSPAPWRMTRNAS